jgi:hypothetical protein
MSMVKIGAMALAAGLAGSVMAEEEHFDVWLSISGGNLVTGAITEDGSATVSGVRVFGAELGEVLPDFSAEPGIQGIDGTFGAGERFGIRILKAVRAWNGASFSSIASSRFQLDFGPQQMVSPIADEVVGGMELAADSEGGIHDHPTFTLLDPTSGIFLLELDVVSIGDVYGATQPFWIVFNNGASEEEHEASIEWVNENLVPTPGVAMVAGMGLVAMGRRRRR